jgi:hypothetical protein
MNTSKTRRLVQLGLLCQKIRVFKYGVPKAVSDELLSYRANLNEMKDDEVLRDIAVNRLEVVNTLLQYAKALNSGDRPTATALIKQAEELWNKGDLIAKEVVNSGI